MSLPNPPFDLMLSGKTLDAIFKEIGALDARNLDYKKAMGPLWDCIEALSLVPPLVEPEMTEEKENAQIPSSIQAPPHLDINPHLIDRITLTGPPKKIMQLLVSPKTVAGGIVQLQGNDRITYAFQFLQKRRNCRPKKIFGNPTIADSQNQPTTAMPVLSPEHVTIPNTEASSDAQTSSSRF